ncbi:hypothetical protein [uncultured Enterovirga sp.]|uniref:hypothetical protein n=1 Tax=uncultured Enterovirga sp. TaxID=2026352 RepID=UPI0035CBC962
MRTAIPSIVALLLAAPMGGCSVRPLPEDVTGVSTVAITKRIQCEAREALDRISVNILRNFGDDRAKKLADLVDMGRVNASELVDRKYLGTYDVGRGEILFRTYTLSAVTFDFKFDIAEENDNSTRADFRLPLVGGLFTVGANAGAKLGRKNNRKFQLTKSFYELHRLDKEECKVIEAGASNVAYPITGRIGLQEVFETFVQLDSGSNSDPSPANRYTDTLTFTTTLSGGTTPTLTLDPLNVRALRVAGANATFKASRTDEHQVAVAIARGELVRSFAAAILDAKASSRIIADELRVENILENQTRGLSVLNDFGR